MTPPRGPVSKALTEHLARITGRPCGFMHLPVTASGEVEELPFTILDPLPSTFSGPAFGDDTADGEWSYQVRSVGERGDAAEWMLDKVNMALFARHPEAIGDRPRLYPVAVPGQHVWKLEAQTSGQQSGAPSDGTVTLVTRFRITTSAT